MIKRDYQSKKERGGKKIMFNFCRKKTTIPDEVIGLIILATMTTYCRFIHHLKKTEGLEHVLEGIANIPGVKRGDKLFEGDWKVFDEMMSYINKIYNTPQKNIEKIVKYYPQLNIWKFVEKVDE